MNQKIERKILFTRWFLQSNAILLAPVDRQNIQTLTMADFGHFLAIGMEIENLHRDSLVVWRNVGDHSWADLMALAWMQKFHVVAFLECPWWMIQRL